MNNRETALLLALQELYGAGRWMLPLTEMPLEKQIALWQAAKEALGRK